MRKKVVSCPACRTCFGIEDLLHSAEIRVLGMNVDHLDSKANFYYFNHEVERCGTTFVVPVEFFTPLVPEPIPDHINLGAESCQNQCVRLHDHSECSQVCKWAPYRRFLQVLINGREPPGEPVKRD